MHALSRLYCRSVTGFNRLCTVSAAWLAVGMVPVLLLEVVMRYLFNSPTSWATELCTLVFGPYFLLAGPYLLHVRGHVNVDILVQHLGPRGRAIMDLITLPVILVFAGLLATVSWPLVHNAIAMGETSFSSWNPPVWPVKLFLPLALVMLALQTLAEMARAACTLAGLPDPCPAPVQADTTLEPR